MTEPVTPPPTRSRRVHVVLTQRSLPTASEISSRPRQTFAEGAGAILASLVVPFFTLAGILITGILTFTSTVFKDNLAPSANIRMYVGRTSVLVSPGATGTITTTIPRGHQLSFFAEQTIDPDGQNEKLKKRWAIVSNAGQDECQEGGGCVSDELNWTPKAEGYYLLHLYVTDDADCPLWRKKVFGRSGCNKTAAASAFFRVIASRQPNIVLQDHLEYVTAGSSIKLDASQSFTFDDQTPLFEWFVNGIRRATTNQIEIASTDARKGRIDVLLNAVDVFGNKTSKAFTLVSVESRPTQTASVGTQPGQAAQVGMNLLCQGGEKYSMTQPLVVHEPGTCRLPKLLVTAGNALELDAGTIEAVSSVIVGFDPAIPSAQNGADGLPGAAGVNGTGEGESGRDGGPGMAAGPGTAGASSGEMSLTARKFQGQLRIDNSGQKGGTGGFGGLGGRGGDGVSGGPAVSGVFDCRRGPGRGGNGGSGGPGGDGGAAGIGGAAARVVLAFGEVVRGSTVDATATGGLQGNSGLGGRGGEGGRGAPEGRSSGLCGGAGRQGHAGPIGQSGSQGASSSPGERAVVSGRFGAAIIAESTAINLLAP